jgi:hypothetical protein
MEQTSYRQRIAMERKALHEAELEQVMKQHDGVGKDTETNC